MKLSIIIPTLDEAERIGDLLLSLAPLRIAGAEIIVADGGSADGTLDLAARLADRALSAPRGRALQMNHGAAVATGDVLLFLHADTRLPPGGMDLIARGLAKMARRWGRFDVEILGRHPFLKVVAAFMNWRSRWSGIATGDQAIFIERDLFEQIGGFPPQPLMEDIEISRRLKRHSAPACLRARVATSGRRWETHGVGRTIALMWWLRLRYFFGAPAERLARRYH